MFSRRPGRLAHLAASAALLLLLGGCNFGGGGRDRVPVGEDPISRAAVFLQGQDLRDDISVPLAMAYIERRWKLGYFTRQVEEFKKRAKSQDASLADLYGRVVDPRQNLAKFSSLPDSGIVSPTMDPIVYLPLVALHCDRFPLPGEFAGWLASEARNGSYRATHAILAMGWASEQGCAEVGKLDVARRLSRESLSETIESLPAGDLLAEAMAMLDYSGSDDLISQSMVARVLASQNPDGSFPVGANTQVDTRHTTVLAMWAILANQRGDVPRTSWIVAPGPPARS